MTAVDVGPSGPLRTHQEHLTPEQISGPLCQCHESGEPGHRDSLEAAPRLFTSGNEGRMRCKTLTNKPNQVNP